MEERRSKSEYNAVEELYTDICCHFLMAILQLFSGFVVPTVCIVSARCLKSSCREALALWNRNPQKYQRLSGGEVCHQASPFDRDSYTQVRRMWFEEPV